MPRALLLTLVLLPVVSSCVAPSVCSPPAGDGRRLAHEALAAPATAASAAPAEDGDEGHWWPIAVALYIPNRILDAFDIVRFGVDVGPGVGVEAQATEALTATAMTRAVVGAGYQTLRHLPVHVAAETALGVGPVGGNAEVGLDWHRSPTDFRLGLHALLAGFHVAIDPVEIIDLPLGFFGFDLAGDDL